MTINLHYYDLPDNIADNSADNLNFLNSDSFAIDTEAMGLKNHRDRLCLVQIANARGECHLIHFPEPHFDRAVNLKNLLSQATKTKIFHYARFDVAILQHSFKLYLENIYCTKIASRLVRTYANRHGLKDLCRELLGIEISKQEQNSDWGCEKLSTEQQKYAASDVLHLHKLKEKLDSKLIREGRQNLAKACFDFIPHRATLDLVGGEEFDPLTYAENKP